MTAKLVRPIRDSRTGEVHKRGETVIIVRQQIEVGTHRTIIVARWETGSSTVLLPPDVTIDEA